jgi:hypothetical protein
MLGVSTTNQKPYRFSQLIHYIWYQMQKTCTIWKICVNYQAFILSS